MFRLPNDGPASRGERKLCVRMSSASCTSHRRPHVWCQAHAGRSWTARRSSAGSRRPDSPMTLSTWRSFVHHRSCPLNACRLREESMTERCRQSTPRGKRVRRRIAVTDPAAGAHRRGARLSREAVYGRRPVIVSRSRSGLCTAYQRKALRPHSSEIWSAIRLSELGHNWDRP